ncbi:transcriptional regulator (nitrogen metabolism) [[Clostridium] ultunense Esp]|uniref:MerR family transcriptional regulator n=1 Tax=Thermicanus aegyptius TaxID=94009 RepID=UPI0002B6F48C|nr:MerR family transcriptional regulator [Thermicanus aegyptius]CCQ96359.1 transcriptional regulator (nitrogen metabolism) [[Clostridium] ultunense Esp]
MNDQFRRTQPLFPIGIVTQLTQLSARQIRYYEEQELITPQRNKGKQRLFSFNDVERLLEIKSLIDQGLNIAGIKQVLKLKEENETLEMDKEDQRGKIKGEEKELSEKELLKMLRDQLFAEGPANRDLLIRGELSRFFH